MKNIYNGELWFAGWKSDHKGKRQVIFELPDDEALECFKGMTARKGNMAGQILMAALVEIGENEESIIQEPAQYKTLEESNNCDHENSSSWGESPKTGPVQEKLKGGTLSKLAGIWSNDDQFLEFLMSEYPSRLHQDPANFIRDYCGVSSRAYIDHNTGSQSRFMDLRKQYMEWLKNNAKV